MSVASSASRQKSWQKIGEVVNLLDALAAKESEVAQRLEHLRKAHGLSQEGAAQKVGVSYRQWQRWEAGGEPRAGNLAAISSAFGVPISELIGERPVETQLDRIEDKLDQIITMLGQREATSTAVIQQAFEDYASRLGERIGKRPVRSRRATDHPTAENPAAA